MPLNHSTLSISYLSCLKEEDVERAHSGPKGYEDQQVADNVVFVHDYKWFINLSRKGLVLHATARVPSISSQAH